MRMWYPNDEGRKDLHLHLDGDSGKTSLRVIIKGCMFHGTWISQASSSTRSYQPGQPPSLGDNPCTVEAILTLNEGINPFFPSY